MAAGLWKPDDGSKPSTANTRKKASKKSDFNENVRIYRDRWAKRKVNYRNKNEKCSTCSRFGFEKYVLFFFFMSSRPDPRPCQSIKSSEYTDVENKVLRSIYGKIQDSGDKDVMTKYCCTIGHT